MNRFEQFVNVFCRKPTKEVAALPTSDEVSDSDFFAAVAQITYTDAPKHIDTGVGLRIEDVATERFTESVPQDVLRASAGLMSSVGSLVGLFSHGGALCAHCVATVGSTVGSVGKIGIPGMSLGHWHGDVWHAEDDPAQQEQPHVPVPAPEKPQRASGPQQALPKAQTTTRSRSAKRMSISDFCSAWFCPALYQS